MNMKHLEELKGELKRVVLATEFEADKDIVGLYKADKLSAIIVSDLVTLGYTRDGLMSDVRCSYLGDEELIAKFTTKG